MTSRFRQPGKSRVVWLLCAPLMLAGLELGHAAAYRIVYPDPYERAQILAASGHGYLAYAPTLLAVAGAFTLCALFHHGASGRVAEETGELQIPAGPFAALPLAAFALQEHLELLIHTGMLPFGATLEPTFLIGLGLQLPFALAAYGLARFLLRAAERIGVSLRDTPPRRWGTAPAAPQRPSPLVHPRLEPLVAGSSGRGPPRSPTGRGPRVRAPQLLPA